MKTVGQNILITGANRGIGKAFAEACAAEKNNLILVVRKRDEDFMSSLKKLGATAVETLEADLSSRAGVEALVKKIQNRRVDILFNNAGLLTGGLLEEQSLDDIYNMFQVNVNALVHLTHAMIPKMTSQRSGKIINHASVSAVMHFPCASTYAAAKAAVWAFTDCIEQELKGTGVSTLCLFTPGIKTRMFDQINDLYSKNMDVPKDHISPEQYAQKILKAVRRDAVYLEPSGKTGLGLMTAKYFRGLFNYGVSFAFKREGLK